MEQQSSSGLERRRSERRSVDYRTYAYIDAARYDVHTEDLSASGAFLATPDRLPVGTVLVLAFAPQTAGVQPVHLVARVVRVKAPPRPGVGVRWLRAATPGSDADLVGFLRDILRVSLDAGALALHRHGRFVHYQFGLTDDTATPPRPRVDPNDDVWKHERYPLQRDAEAPARRFDGPGSVTGVFLTEDFRVKSRIAGQLVYGKALYPAMVVEVGLKSLAVLCDGIPFTPGTRHRLRLEVSTTEKLYQVELMLIAQGRGSGPTTLFAVESLVEEGKPGLFEKYVKWHFVKEVAIAPRKAGPA